MSWLGVGILGGLGFAIGGPIGAGIGAFFGSSIGKSNKYKKLNNAEENQAVFFVSLFSMLSKMAIADGVVSQQEIDAVTKFMHTIKLDDKDKEAAIKIFRNAKLDNYSIYDYASQYHDIASLEMRQMIYNALWEVAISDGTIHPLEDDILQNIPNYLGIPETVYHQFKSQTTGQTEPELTQYYEILACSENATNAEVKTAYRRAMKEYHPDKIHAKGLPDAFLKFANEQSKKINKAYKVIKKDRGL